MPILDRLHRFASKVAVILASFGAAVLVCAAFIVCYSVLLRTFTGGQVLGDFEIMAMASGIAIVLFLPYCQATHSHVLIEVFSNWLPPHILRIVDGLWALLLAAGAAFLAYRLFIGMEEAWARNDVTMLRQLPRAVVYGAAVVGAAGTAVLALLDFLLAFVSGKRAEGSGMHA